MISTRAATAGLAFASLALLIPGITLPVLTIEGTLEKDRVVETGKDLIVDAILGQEDEDGVNSDDQRRAKTRERVSGMMRLFGLGELQGEFQAYQRTRSILGTVRQLFETGHVLVGFLVMLFSVIVPTIKIVLVTTAALGRKGLAADRLLAIGNAIGKWSMADVFVVGIIVSYLAANASEGIGDLVQLNAHFGTGFYFFLGYCLFSVASTQIAAHRYQVRANG